MIFINNFQFFRKEPLLEIDEYTKPAHREELVALAQTIQNLIIIEKGTMPNDPDFGVGLGSYIFEFMDSTTLNEMRISIEEQISKYIFHGRVSVRVVISPVKLPIQNSNTLRIVIVITPGEQATNYTSTEEEIRLDYAFSANSQNSKIVSRLLN